MTLIQIVGAVRIVVGECRYGVRTHSIVADKPLRRTIFSSLAQALACLLLMGGPLFAANHPGVTGANANCTLCHADLRRGASVHSRGELRCGMCHMSEPEGNTAQMLLTAPKEQLCFACHERAAMEQHVSPGSKKDCLGCHDAHRSARAMLLRRNVEEHYAHSIPVPAKSAHPNASKLKSRTSTKP